MEGYRINPDRSNRFTDPEIMELAFSNRGNLSKVLGLPSVFRKTPWKAARYAFIELRDLFAALWLYRVLHWLIIALYWSARAVLGPRK